MKLVMIALYILNAAFCLFAKYSRFLHVAACLGWLIAAMWLARVPPEKEGGAE